MYVKDFREISKNDFVIVGGKGASLGEMLNAGIPVPPGFVITTEAFRKFQNQELPIDVKREILDAFDKLGTERVAVRSSAVAEDSSSASWAGQLETYLNVDREDLMRSVIKCWGSISSERAKAYAAEQKTAKENLAVAVVIQQMVESEKSGVTFTINPITQNRDELVIEAGYGLGELLVQGLITPDTYVVDKRTFKVISKSINRQDKMLVFRDGKNKMIEVLREKRHIQVLYDAQIRHLVKIALDIETHFRAPQDIEWAFEDGKFYIVQSRPITTLS